MGALTSRLSRTLRRIRESSAPPVSSPFLRSRPFSPPAHVSKRPITGCGAFRANVWIRVGEREGTKDEWDRIIPGTFRLFSSSSLKAPSDSKF